MTPMHRRDGKPRKRSRGGLPPDGSPRRARTIVLAADSKPKRGRGPKVARKIGLNPQGPYKVDQVAPPASRLAKGELRNRTSWAVGHGRDGRGGGRMDLHRSRRRAKVDPDIRARMARYRERPVHLPDRSAKVGWLDEVVGVTGELVEATWTTAKRR